MPAGLLVAWVAVVLVAAWQWRPAPARVLALLGRPARRPGRPDRRWTLAGRAAVAAAAAFTWPPLAALVLVVLVALPHWQARRARLAHRAVVLQGLPEVADLLVLAVGTGLNPLLALRRIAPLAPPPYAAALAETLRHVDQGVRLGDALAHLECGLGPAVAPVVAALTATERYGTPLGPALDALAHDARLQRRHLAHEAARRLPVRLAFPLVCCILPAFVLLTVAPLVAGALTSLHLSAP